MFKRVVSRVKAWITKPPPPPPLHYRVKECLYSFFASIKTKIGKIDGTNDKKDDSDPINKHQPSITSLLGSQVTESAKIENIATGDKSKDPKPDDQKNLKIDIPPPQSGKMKGYLWGMSAFIGTWFTRTEIGSAVLGLFGLIGYYVWQEDLSAKYRLIWMAQDKKQIEDLLLDEWRGLKTNVSIEVEGETTPLPQWDWKWFFLSIPRALCSLDPLHELSNDRYEQSKATITLIDFSPIISKVLGIPASQFIILDGQKGTGKSTAMLLLCWHEILNHRAALFLRLSEDQHGIKRYSPSKAVRRDPSFIETLAEVFQRRHKKFTIVVDDLHRYLNSADTKKNAIISRLLSFSTSGSYSQQVTMD